MWRPFDSPAPIDDDDGHDDDDGDNDDDDNLLGKPPLREYHLLKSSFEDPMPDHNVIMMLVLAIV